MRKEFLSTAMICLLNLSLFADAPSITCPELGLKKLMEGNKRFAMDQLEHPNRNLLRRQAITAKQKPFAAIVGCADSRVSPEIIFDQGVGDLFVVRVAGNVIGPLELDSIDYAALILNSCLIIVMGHENCGAVNAVIQNTTKDIESVAELIQPAVDIARKENSKDLLEASIKENALRMKQYLLDSNVIGRYVKEGKVQVHAAYYNLESGVVDILTD